MSDVFFEFKTVINLECQKITLTNTPVFDHTERKRGFIENATSRIQHTAFIWNKRDDGTVKIVALRSLEMSLIGKDQYIETIVNESYKKTIEGLIVE